ncbi:uncharacterized protein LOC128503893 [Spea bombifrons]|uniref:uncharacterized protein LOC128503893 n=1 Tax=Spea bombifrons TaxID=233779 RepID=UPI002348F189|nr:uncharacterized protein LOC128503893 [Spea bombifrons]
MSATKAESSAKRKRSKPHKLGDKKRILSRKDSEEIVPSSQESSRGRNEEFEKEREHSPARSTEESVPQKCPNGGNSTPRGRGRPKGSKNKTFTASSIMVSRARNGQYQRDLHHTQPFPKHEEKREHPGGGDIPHRGRGRPKGSKNKAYPGSLKVTVQSAGENMPKRTRGRPKGSLNKNPSKAALKVKTEVPKMGRGRPKKILATNGAVVPKRARGRPKGSLNKRSSAKKVDGGSRYEGNHHGSVNLVEKIRLHRDIRGEEIVNKLKGVYTDGGSDRENRP